MFYVARYWSQRGLGPSLALQIPIIVTMKSSTKATTFKTCFPPVRRDLESLHKVMIIQPTLRKQQVCVKVV